MNILKIIVILICVIFLIYAIWLWWDTKNLQAFCAELKSGTLMSAVPTLAENHHLNSRWIASSILNEETKTWFTYLPAESTMGDVVCAIEHDKIVVLSSKYSER